MANVSVALEPVRPEIPDKLYFRIGEVSRLAGVKPHVLRFWETEFPALNPKKSGSGHRLYRRKDVEVVLEIRKLLYEDRFTIEGARRAIEIWEANQRRHPPPPPRQGDLFSNPMAALEEIRRELTELVDLLK